MASMRCKPASRSTSKSARRSPGKGLFASAEGPFAYSGHFGYSGPRRTDRPRARLLVDRDEGEQAFGDLDLGRAAVARGDDLDPDLHRGPADAFDLGIDRDQVAQVDRRDELHPLDRDRRHRPVGAVRATMPAAMSIWLSTQPPKIWPLALMSLGPGDDAQDRLAVEIRSLAHPPCVAYGRRLRRRGRSTSSGTPGSSARCRAAP